MSDAPESHGFTMSRHGKDYRVVVSRETVEDAMVTHQLSAESMYGWVRDHADLLTRLAERKIGHLGPGEYRIVITTAELNG